MASQVDVYARVSRASDDRQRSVRGQVDDCAARLAELGHTVGVIHVDNSLSAWSAGVRRPGWDRLMARLESGETDGTIVFDLARFSRRPIEGERLIAAAERGVLVLDSEDSYDLTTANGKKQFRDALAGAAYESDRLSTRVRRGKRAKATRGEPNNSWRAFGFEDDGVTPRAEEADVLREMVRRTLAGESQDAVVTDLNARGITTTRGNRWTRTGLRQLLLRPRNAGIIVHKGEHVGKLPGEPVIPPDDWERLCALFASRRVGRPPSHHYLASGLVMCGLCGHRLYGRPRVNLRPYPDGAVRRQYWCQTGDRGGCQRISIDQRALDEHLAALALAILSDSRHAAQVEAAARERADQAAELDAAILEAEHLANELAGRLGRGEISIDRYDTAVKPLDARLARLRADRDALPDEPAPADPAASRAEWEARWQAATVEERRDLLRMALRRRRVVVMPADRRDRRDIAGRVRVEGDAQA